MLRADHALYRAKHAGRNRTEAEILADNFPGAFSGYELEVTESHQSSKVDTSGTARDVVASFAKLGVAFEEHRIQRVRDRKRQVELMGVPEEALGGHAFHTYNLTSPDRTVGFVFKHNVVGRSTYAEGTVDALLFLQKQIAEGAEQRVYNMVDVLKAGALGVPAIPLGVLRLRVDTGVYADWLVSVLRDKP